MDGHTPQNNFPYFGIEVGVGEIQTFKDSKLFLMHVS